MTAKQQLTIEYVLQSSDLRISTNLLTSVMRVFRLSKTLWCCTGSRGVVTLAKHRLASPRAPRAFS